MIFLSEFDWIRFNLHRSASIYIDPHRSTLICLDLNLKISSIFRIYQDFDSLFTFHNYEWRICSPKSRILRIFKIWKIVFSEWIWLNSIQFASICVDLHRSTSIHIDPHSFASIWTLRFHRFFGYIKILTHFSLFIWERSTTDPSGDSQIAWV